MLDSIFSTMHAETAYLFRHALLRDAAYQLQLPGDRARLHALAIDIIESVLGASAPDAHGEDEPELHVVDPYALELMDHAAVSAREGSSAHSMRELDYLYRAAKWAHRQSHLPLAAALFARVSGHSRALPALRLKASLAELQTFVDAGTPQLSTGKAGICATLAIGLKDARGEARAHLLQGLLLQQMARFDESLSEFEIAGSVAANAALPELEGAALMDRASVLGQVGQQDQANECAQHALERFTVAKDRHGLMRARATIASFHLESGNTELAETGLTQSIDECRAAGDARGLSHSLGNLAILRDIQGRYHEAIPAFTQAILQFQQLGDKMGEAIARANYSGLLSGLARHEEAMAELLTALATHRETGNRYSEGIVLGMLGFLAYEQRDLAEAERRHREAIALAMLVNNLPSLGREYGNLANVYADLSRFDDAQQCYEKSLEIHRRTGQRRSESITIGGMASLQLQRGNLPETERLLRSALEIDEATQNRRPEGFHRCELAVCLLKRGEEARARESWRKGINLLRSMGEVLAAQEKAKEMKAACIEAGIEPFDGT